jgi:hypothetical protein
MQHDPGFLSVPSSSGTTLQLRHCSRRKLHRSSFSSLLVGNNSSTVSVAVARSVFLPFSSLLVGNNSSTEPEELLMRAIFAFSSLLVGNNSSTASEVHKKQSQFQYRQSLFFESSFSAPNTTGLRNRAKECRRNNFCTRSPRTGFSPASEAAFAPFRSFAESRR